MTTMPDHARLPAGYILEQILGDDYGKYPEYHDSIIALWQPRLNKASEVGYLVGLGNVEQCPDCGPIVEFDEDGCCITCGADMEAVPVMRALESAYRAGGEDFQVKYGLNHGDLTAYITRECVTCGRACRDCAKEETIMSTGRDRGEIDMLNEELFIVRFYDGFDHEWMDVSVPLSREGADRVWNEKTENGTRNTKYDDIDYFRVFPVDTKMFFS